jgi:hypothetical protein
MADEQFYSGSLFMLYIRNSGTWKPVACLTSNGISESWDFAETVTKCDPGVTRRKPTTYSYEIPFEGVFTDTSGAGGDTAKASWDTIKNIARAKTLTEYQIALLRENGTEDPNFSAQFGAAYFSALDITGAEGEFITFSGTMLGDGDITETDPYPGY